MLVYMDGALTLNYYWTGYSLTPHFKGCLYRARPWTRTRPRTLTRRSHWIAYKQFVWSRFHKRRPRTRLEIGSCGTVAELRLERVFRRWSRELFLVNQSVLCFLELGPGFTPWTLYRWKWSSVTRWWYLPYTWRFCKIGCTYVPLYILFLLLLRVKR